eukprot:8285952-Alexandrium_andersonii.AAC.1
MRDGTVGLVRVSITVLVRMKLERAIAELPVDVRARRCRSQAKDGVEFAMVQQAWRQAWERLAP